MVKRKAQTKNTIYKQDVYLSNLSHGRWAIIIMPENIVIDNHHDKGVHIHPKPEKHEEEILLKFENKVEIFNKIIEHIRENKKLILDELIGELKK